MPFPSSILLVLDLDETLIHASKEPLDRPADFAEAAYHVYKRPYLDDFLERMAAHFTIGIWSSAGDVYVRSVAAQISTDIPFHFVWGRSRCTMRLSSDRDHYYPEKRLAKLKKQGFVMEQVLIVDDTPAKARANYGNAVYVSPFTGDASDTELLQLGDYLLSLKECPDVRTIEKRGWKNTFQKSVEAHHDNNS